MGRMIIKGNQCYEIDEECVRRKRESGKKGQKPQSKRSRRRYVSGA